MDAAATQDIINRLWAARLANDTATLHGFLAHGATYEMVGASAFASSETVGPAAAKAAVERLIAEFRFHDVEQLSAVFERGKAAVVQRVSVSFRGGTPVSTEVCDVWTFDEAGLVTSLRQFTDTALVSKMINAG